MADKGQGAGGCRAFELGDARSLTGSGFGYDSIGKLLIVPVTQPTYGNSGVDGLLKQLGLHPDKNKGESGTYAYLGDSVVVDHSKRVIDLDVMWKHSMSRRPSKNKRSSYVIPHGDVSFSDLVSFRKALKALMTHDKR